VIITRTPFRISFAGGGSDFPSFFEQEPGMVCSAAINRYMYLTVKQRFGNGFRVSYSTTEICQTAEQVQHPIVRECLRMLGERVGLEIVSIADLPAQSGMGSSSSFTVGLLSALHAWHGRSVSAEQLAREACQVEIDRLHEPIGRQDQYIAAFGGIQFIQFQPDGSVLVDPVVCGAATKAELSRRLLLFHTGEAREAKSVLASQNALTNANRPALRDLCGVARAMRDVLTAGRDLNRFGYLLHDAWEIKKTLEASISNPSIDRLYQLAREGGALGGKLLGAGKGGFLLFFCEPNRQDTLREALSEITEVPFGFEPQGAKVIYVGEDRW
jgi:D-glycero-alpha-D-manno-heptose-7-phosphate kinase